MNTKKIVIVEDEKMLAQALADTLIAEGYAVTIESDGENALGVILEQKPDLVVLDIMLPGQTGTFVLQELRYNPQTEKLPAVIISNIAEVPNLVEEGGGPELTSFLFKANVSLTDIVEHIKERLTDNA